MFRILPHLISASGLIILLLGLASYSGSSIPFQDAPAELLIQQQNDIYFACLIMVIGLCATCFGLALLIYRRRKPTLPHHSNQTPSDAS